MRYGSGLQYGCNEKPQIASGASSHYLGFTCKSAEKRVDLRGLEPLTSAMRGRHDALLDHSRVCKIAANSCISVFTRFLTFQEIHSGCCTVGAQRLRCASAQRPG